MLDVIWEIAAMTYLTRDRGLFVNPQYLVGELKSWEASVDFLALDFEPGQAWMVEVTTSTYKFRDKISKFRTEYAPRIEQQLMRHKVVCTQGQWKIGLWIFCRSGKQTDIVKRRALAAGIEDAFKCTSIEETVAAGGGWEERFK